MSGIETGLTVDKTLTTAGLTAHGDAEAPHDVSRALVVVTPRGDSEIRRPVYRPAVFLAHLIAMKDKHLQTRERRRVEPFEAMSAYRRAMAATR